MPVHRQCKTTRFPDQNVTGVFLGSQASCLLLETPRSSIGEEWARTSIGTASDGRRDACAYLPPRGEGAGGWGASRTWRNHSIWLDPHPFIPSPQGGAKSLASRLSASSRAKSTPMIRIPVLPGYSGAFAPCLVNSAIRAGYSMKSGCWAKLCTAEVMAQLMRSDVQTSI
jgi:hypothetical protein